MGLRRCRSTAGTTSALSSGRQPRASPCHLVVVGPAGRRPSHASSSSRRHGTDRRSPPTPPRSVPPPGVLYRSREAERDRERQQGFPGLRAVLGEGCVRPTGLVTTQARWCWRPLVMPCRDARRRSSDRRRARPDRPSHLGLRAHQKRRRLFRLSGPVGSHGDTRQVLVGGTVGGYHLSLGGVGGGSNDQVVGSARSPLAANGDQ